MQYFPGRILFIFSLLAVGLQVEADGIAIDKVYDPYVQLLEKELEYRSLYEQDSNKAVDGRGRHKIGYGQAVSDQFFVELYLTGVDEPGGNLELESYEVEVKWQLSEQGEYDNDWGLLFELEKEKNENAWEISTTLIAVHEWSDWVATGNLSVIYEWGSDITNEWETALATQLRYRSSEKVEFGIELYQAEDTQGIGPVATGLWRIGQGKKLNWEFGAILGTNSDTADVNWKFNLEYEFL